MSVCAHIPALVFVLTSGIHSTYPPIPKNRAVKIVKATCQYYNKDPLLLLAVLAKETEFNPYRCYKGAHGIGQIQLRPHSCRRTKKLAKHLGLYNIKVGIRKAVGLLNLWKRYCKKYHSWSHPWLLHYNQGMGRCPRNNPKCSRYQRVPITKGHVGGYAKRILKIKVLLQHKLQERLKLLERIK